MPGRGGRSKGCVTCRRRRVKCDQQRPECGRCIKGGFECGGYAETTFISVSPGTQSAPVDTQAPSEEVSMSLVSTRSSSVASELSDLTWDSRVSPPPILVQQEDVHPDDAFRFMLALDLPVTAFREDIYVSYTLERLVRGGPLNMALQKLDSTLVRPSFLSLATLFFGVHHQQVEIMRDAYQSYAAVLLDLNQALRDPAQQTSTAVLTSVMTLCMFECFVPSSNMSWTRHARGLERILELRVASRGWWNPLERSLLQQAFPCIIAAALVERRPVSPAVAQALAANVRDAPADDGSDVTLEYLNNVLAQATLLYGDPSSGSAEAGGQPEQKIATALATVEKISIWCIKLGERLSEASLLSAEARLQIRVAYAFCNGVLILLLEMATWFMQSQEYPRERMLKAAFEVGHCIAAHMQEYPDGRHALDYILPALAAREVISTDNSPAKDDMMRLLRAGCGDLQLGMWQENNPDLSRNG